MILIASIELMIYHWHIRRRAFGCLIEQPDIERTWVNQVSEWLKAFQLFDQVAPSPLSYPFIFAQMHRIALINRRCHYAPTVHLCTSVYARVRVIYSRMIRYNMHPTRLLSCKSYYLFRLRQRNYFIRQLILSLFLFHISKFNDKYVSY